MYVFKRVSYFTFNSFLIIFCVVFSSITAACDNLSSYHKEGSIHVYTIIDSINSNEATYSIINSHDIEKSIKEQYENSKIIEKRIPLQRKNNIDFHSTNFPSLASERKWSEIENESKNEIIYLKWNVSSVSDSILYFLYSSDYDCSLCVNDSLILSEKGKTSTPFYQKSKLINLRKGNNQFVVQLLKKRRLFQKLF